MCGIVGWSQLNTKAVCGETDKQVLRSMCAKIVHRGPDSEGVFIADEVALGMRRLSIIDLVKGGQPIFSESGSVVVVVNGEIYNFQELRRQLKQRGHIFKTDADVEILPHLYEEYGEQMLTKLNGMFAFALWDSARKKLFLARDRFGEKPLYYAVFGGKLLFASEIKSLLAHPSVETRLDLCAMRQYLAYDYVPAPVSIYEGIFKLPAAHSLTLENGNMRLERYWDLSFRKRKPAPSVDEAAEHLRELLADATRSRMVSDVPLGVFLSGGVDSSSIAAFAQQFSNTPVKTFSIGFEDASFNESHYARQTSQHLGTQHHEVVLSGDTTADLLSEIGSWLDEPMADASILPTFLLSRFVRSEVTVALGGDGGDEIFGGYPWYYAHKIAERYEKLPLFLRKSLCERIIKNLPIGTKNMAFGFIAKRFIRSMAFQDVIERHQSFMGSFTSYDQNSLLTDEFRPQNSDIFDDARKWLQVWDDENLDSSTSAIATDHIVERMQFLDMKFFLAEGILAKLDRASMAVSLEVRSPFLDPRIAELSASLPRDYKLNCRTPKFAFGRSGKFVLKKAMAPILPRKIIQRKKQGFNVPIAAWLRTILNPLLRELLAFERIRKQRMFNPAYVSRLLREHETVRADHSKTLWTLLVFQIWLENFLPNGH